MVAANRGGDEREVSKSVIACPDPHIERWYLADPTSLAEALEVKAPREPRQCQRERYKQMLAESLRKAGHLLTLNGIEFADEIVRAMDLYQAGRNEPSFKHFLDDLLAAIRSRRG